MSDQLTIVEATIKETEVDLGALEAEVKAVYKDVVLPTWGLELHGLPNTLYGYMMGVFSRIDLYSAYSAGTTSSAGQTRRMTGFMDRYLSQDQEANFIAVQL